MISQHIPIVQFSCWYNIFKSVRSTFSRCTWR